MSSSRYIVGIDLGTTNCAVAYIDTAESRQAQSVQSFPIPQLVKEATTATQSTLPSFLYLPGPHDLPAGSLGLAWDTERDYAVGDFARLQGARVPGRLLASAKSWLCHADVDRNAAILPWGSPPEVNKLSPVEASARYVLHIREAWNQEMGKGHALEAQHVILTVPASFDEVARELTVQAAAQAGLTKVTLLEEPQAAFYAWLAAHADSWQRELQVGSRILVCDVGGGTTDLSLMAVLAGTSQIEIHRIAVGEHLLLGGDNMDIALARLVEQRLTKGGRLDAQRWHSLCHLCRRAKEDIFADANQDGVAITLAGRGSAIVGGTLKDKLERQEVESVVLNGFFPHIEKETMPRRGARVGLQEFGLPYASEPEIPRHIAQFLSQQAAADEAAIRPDAILFNGGALTPIAIRQRVVDMLSDWFSVPSESAESAWKPTVLTNMSLKLAVAHGAAYYGLVRRGQGVRIGGGSARAYYIGIGGQKGHVSETDETISALCLVRRGMEEGEEIRLREPEFEVIANQPVSFPLYASSIRQHDQPGTVLRLPAGEISSLPAIRTVLRFGKKTGSVKIPVHVSARFTEVGTLELWCEARQTSHRWRLQFQLRGEASVPSGLGGLGGPGASSSSPTGVQEEHIVDEVRLEEAGQLVRAVFSAAGRAGEAGVTPQNLIRQLEHAIGTTKDSWPLSAIRMVGESVLAGEKGRAHGAEYEARWLNLGGFLLRPGFGHATDEWRMQQLWKLYPRGPIHKNALQCRAEWWNLWKRIAGGLSRQQQNVLYTDIAAWVLPHAKGKIKSGAKRSKLGSQELREMWQVLGSCERLNAETKANLGEELVRLVAKGKASNQEIWALSRLGARRLIYGPANCVVRREVATRWIEQLLDDKARQKAGESEALAFALVQIAQCTGDRTRDLDQAIRQKVVEYLTAFPAGQGWAKQVLEVVALEAKEQARILDESLPAGLQIRGGEGERS